MQTVKDAEGTGGAAPSPHSPVESLLRQQSDKFNAGDIEGYLAPFAPAARAFEEPIIRRVAALPLARIDLSIAGGTISDDGNHFTGAVVILRYLYKELPADNPFRFAFAYDLDRQPQGWVIAKAKIAVGPQIPPPPPIALDKPVEFTRTPHLLVMSEPGVPGVEGFAADAETAYTELLPKLPLETDKRALLVLARDTKEYESYGGSGAAQTSVWYVSGPAYPTRPEGRFVFADLEAVTDAGKPSTLPDGLVVPPATVFRHELAHLALSRFDRPCTPAWVAEAGAMLLASEDRSPQWKGMVARDELDKVILDAPAVNYPFADAAVLVLVAKADTATFYRYFQNFKNLPECRQEVPPNVRSALDERLLRRYYRFGVADLEAATRDYIRKAVAAQ